ncbi:MAG: hypothetical protein DMD87_30385, partial [Candidatus Rokuibacteriota bacterium]
MRSSACCAARAKSSRSSSCWRTFTGSTRRRKRCWTASWRACRERQCCCSSTTDPSTVTPGLVRLTIVSSG